jgi:hypothetical protein
LPVPVPTDFLPAEAAPSRAAVTIGRLEQLTYLCGGISAV